MDIVERLKKRKEIIIAANPNGVITQANRDAIEAADEIERLREALQWYGEMARLCRLNHSGGDGGRNALATDGGAKARSALQQKESE